MVSSALKSRPSFLLAAIVALTLAGCAAPAPEKPVFPQITFGQFQPIRLNVGAIEIEQRYQAPGRLPNVEHAMPIAPAAMAEQWGRDRLRAVPSGGTGSARLVIERASVVEIDLPKTPGIRGAFTTDQTQRYDAVLDVVLEIRNDRGFRESSASARIERTQTIREDASVADRERLWFSMTEAMAKDLNTEMEKQIQGYFGRFIAY